jgi:phage tail sheath protein FI
MYDSPRNINPITFFPGRGILIWGQKTSSPATSAMDRINVVRGVMYLRRVLRKGAMPFVFEPNDQITRDNLKSAADGLLNDMMVKRGLMDFATYCDATNNTPTVIDNNQLILDVAIKPTRAAEFIYIPIRVVSTSASI